MLRKSALLLCLVLSLFACNKNNKVKGTKAASGTAAVWQKIPQDTFFAMAFNRPAQSGPQMKEALTKMGLFGDFYKDADIDDMQKELGIDPFQPETLTAIGLDLSKGIALAVDGKLTTGSPYYNNYSQTITRYVDPVFFAVAGLSDAKKFSGWLATTSARSGYRLFAPKMDGAVSEKDIPLTFLIRPAQYEQGKEQAQLAVASKDGYLYTFFVEATLPSADMPPETINPVDDFAKQLPDFWARTATSITTKSNFASVAQQIQAKDDCMMYFDVLSFSEQFTLLNKRDVIFLPTTDNDIKRQQDEEKRYLQEDIQRDIKELNTIRALAAAFPAFGMGGTLEKSKMSCEGYSLVGQSYQEDVKAVLQPSTETPAYGKLFPSGTGFVYRESFNLMALKNLVFRFATGPDLADMQQDWNDFASTSQVLGLDMEKDILGSLTGHLAIGAPDLAAFAMPWFRFSPSSEGPSIPSISMIIQVTSAEAGDKIIKAFQPMLDSVGVRTETVEGEKVYWFQADEVNVSWARVNNTIVGALSLEATKEMVKNAKKPGASIVEKLPNQLSQSLLTDKNATGCTADMGSFFSTIAKYNNRQQESSSMYQLGASLGSSTMKIAYEDNGVRCRGDLVIK